MASPPSARKASSGLNSFLRSALLSLVFIVAIQIFAIGSMQLRERIIVSPLHTQKTTAPLTDKYFFAANFHNSAEILPRFRTEVFKLIELLGEKNVYISIYENGSKDNTKALLHSFQADLHAAGVKNSIITCGLSGSGYWSYTRVADRFLKYAALRNVVLDLLISDDFPFKQNIDQVKIVFFNDVFFTADHVTTLLSTHNGEFDMACALDFHSAFYDVLATRDIQGDFFHDYYPFVTDPISQFKLRAGEPFQVFACWNGIVAMSAVPFAKHGVRFRASEPTRCECPQSECLLIGLDYWHTNHSRIYVNPNVKVAYEWNSYLYHQYLFPLINPIIGFFNPITLSSAPPAEALFAENLRNIPETIGCYKPLSWDPDRMPTSPSSSCDQFLNEGEYGRPAGDIVMNPSAVSDANKGILSVKDIKTVQHNASGGVDSKSGSSSPSVLNKHPKVLIEEYEDMFRSCQLKSESSSP